jgi:preprotein translocase subunit SecF
MSRLGTLGARLYRGEVSYDFIAHRKIWYGVSAALLVISIVSLLTLRLTLGIEFRGGAEFRVKSPTVTQDAVRSTVENTVKSEIVVQSVGPDTVRVQTETLTTDEAEKVRGDLAKEFGVSRNSVSTQVIGPSWGKDISSKALRALIFFLLGVVGFLSLYFEWKMALAAMIALLHDLVITAGLYSLVGFEVTPATVIGFLTILGYSLYDTVVVFDKVRENTQGLAGGSRMTFSQATNLAVNQTLVRSINTSIIALLPIAAILFAGVVLLGAGPLKDLSLALFIGVAVGAYSSIFIAPPLLASFKEREPAMQALAKRVASRRTGTGVESPSARRRAAAGEPAATAPDADTALDDAAVVAAAAGAAQRPSAQPRRPAGGAQRSQPRKGSGSRNKSKKRR